VQYLYQIFSTKIPFWKTFWPSQNYKVLEISILQNILENFTAQKVISS
jgi:hypothetical protein